MSIADQMLNGEMCEGCGEWLLDENGDLKENQGIPDYCSSGCAIDRGADWWLEAHGYDVYGRRLRA